MESTISFTSTRDGNGEIYLIDPNNSNPRRLTTSTDGDALPTLSPDGKKIVFDSNRNIAGAPINRSDLFVMNADGTDQTFLVRGSSATWSPDCKQIAFHASASGTGTPLRTDPGSATTDSDLFIVNVDDLLDGADQPTNITTSTDKIDDDADWSPDGHTIAYTAHDVGDHPFLSNTAEVYLIDADGSGTPTPLTDNNEEERAPAWSPDGERIAYMCRIGGGATDFETCVMNADGTGVQQLTDNTVGDLAAGWSPDGQHILFVRPVPGAGQQLFVMNADGSNQTQLTFPPGFNTLAQWGELRVHAAP